MVPRWLSWLFVLFLGYVIITGNRGFLTQEAAPEKAARDEHIAEYYPAIHALVDGERWMRAINPEYKNDKPCAPQRATKAHLGSYAILEEQGAGDLSACGDTMHFTATLWNAQGTAEKKLTDRTLVLGEQPGLDALLVSMAIHETRMLIVTVPAEGYKALPELKKGQLQMLTVTRESAKDAAEEKSGEESHEDSSPSQP